MKSFNIVVGETELGNWQASIPGDGLYVEGHSPGSAVDGLVNIINYWDTLEGDE